MHFETIYYSLCPLFLLLLSMYFYIKIHFLPCHSKILGKITVCIYRIHSFLQTHICCIFGTFLSTTLVANLPWGGSMGEVFDERWGWCLYSHSYSSLSFQVFQYYFYFVYSLGLMYFQKHLICFSVQFLLSYVHVVFTYSTMYVEWQNTNKWNLTQVLAVL